MESSTTVQRCLYNSKHSKRRKICSRVVRQTVNAVSVDDLNEDDASLCNAVYLLLSENSGGIAARSRGISQMRYWENSLIGWCIRSAANNLGLLKTQKNVWSIVSPDLKTRILFLAKEHLQKEFSLSLFEEFGLFNGLSAVNLRETIGLNNRIVCSITKVTPMTITWIDLSSNLKISNAAVRCLIIANSQILRHLNLKNCVNLTDEALPASEFAELQRLEYINLSFTQFSLTAFKKILLNCSSIKVIKFAGLRIGDCALEEIFNLFKPVKLIKLNLRHSNIGIAGVQCILSSCPNLTALDVSYCRINNLPMLSQSFPGKLALEKLNISFHQSASSWPDLSICVRWQNFCDLLAAAPRLRCIYFGGSRAWSAGDQTCDSTFVSNVLNKLEIAYLPQSQLSANHLKMFLVNGACLQYLDLANCSYLKQGKAGKLAALVDGNVHALPELRILNLDCTTIGDEDAEAVAHWHNLESLFLKSTNITEQGVTVIVTGCRKVDISLDGCRGIKASFRSTLVSDIRMRMDQDAPQCQMERKSIFLEFL